MNKLEEAKMIVRLNEEIELTVGKLDFIDGKYQDEFFIGYSGECYDITECDTTGLSMSDVECLREFWEKMKKELEAKLAELLK